MPNGREVGKANVAALEAWAATQSDEDFTQIVYQGKLNRSEVAKGSGIGKSSLKQNPAVRNALKSIEDGLRQRGVLPPLTEKAQAQSTSAKAHDQGAQRRMLDSKRASLLEQENIELKARVQHLESQLARYCELSEVLSEVGMVPR